MDMKTIDKIKRLNKSDLYDYYNSLVYELGKRKAINPHSDRVVELRKELDYIHLYAGYYFDCS